MVNQKVTKLPVGVIKCFWMFCNHLLTSERASRCSIRSLLAIQQIATEIDVGNNGVVLEVGADVAACAWEVGNCHSPCLRLRSLVGDIAWDGTTGKLPHADAGVTPFDSHDAAALLIELFSVRGLVGGDATSRVAVCLDVAVCLSGASRHISADIHGALARSVEGHGVSIDAVVGGFHNVDLAVGRPVGGLGIGKPEGRPCSATVRGVLNIKDEKSLVVLLLGLDADRVATSCLVVASGVDTEIDRLVIGRSTGQVL